LITLIVIYVLTQLGSSAVSAQAMTDTNQKRLMFALPFLFVPFIINFPAGLLVYWITTNSWTIAQQLLIRKVLPPPHLKDAKDEPAGSPEPVPAGEKRGLAKLLAGVAEGGKAAAADRTESRKSGNGGAAGATKRSSTKTGGAAVAGTKTAGKRDGARANGGAKAGKKSAGDGAKAAKKPSGDGGNGRAEKAPPPSPRKKKKRSGRRR
jgi:YidC/Oxa1 family membrane protein insertase